MVNRIIGFIACHINNKLIESESDYTFSVGYNSQFKDKSITLRMIRNADEDMFLNKTNSSVINIGFTIKDRDQLNVYETMDLINEWMNEIRFMDNTDYTLYSQRVTSSNLINLTEQDIYIGDIVFEIGYVDKALR